MEIEQQLCTAHALSCLIHLGTLKHQATHLANARHGINATLAQASTWTEAQAACSQVHADFQ